MLKKRGRRWLGLLLAAAMLVQGNAAVMVSAEDAALADGGDISLVADADRRNFAIP